MSYITNIIADNFSLDINAVDSSNIVANFNTNNANQVNIMPTGKKKKRSVVEASSVALVSLIKLALLLDQERSRDCQILRICSATESAGLGNNKSHKSGLLEEMFWRFGHSVKSFPFTLDFRIYGLEEKSDIVCALARKACINPALWNVSIIQDIKVMRIRLVIIKWYLIWT